jgi:uncharacterized protein YndB with AHSA1/START domain
MDKPRFVYAIEIAATPERLWMSLTSQEFWQQFSGPVESDWKTGSAVRFFLPDGNLYSEGVILQADPPRLLSHTWPDPEGDQGRETAQRITWRIEQRAAGSVNLTMVHENLTAKAYQGVSHGWPLILKSLKSLLETGVAQPIRA